MRRLVVRDCTVVDVTNGSLAPGVDVHVVGGRISRIVPHDDSAGRAHSEAESVDAGGAFVIPGLVDRHAHVLDQPDPRRDLRLMLSNGVTGFRQMSGSSALLRARPSAGSVERDDEPACLAMPGEVLTPMNAGSVEAVLATIRGQHENGADFIKVALVEPDVLGVAQEEANRLDLDLVGGMKSVEHLGPGLGILAACSSAEEEIMAGLARSPRLSTPPSWLPGTGFLMGILLRRIVTNPFLMWRLDAVELLRLAVDTFDEDRAREVAAELARNETWQGATLVRQCACVCGDTERFQANDDLRYMDPRTRRHWDRFGAKFDKLPSLQKEAFRDMYDLQLRITYLFDAEGVRVLAGSDAGGGIWEVPGFALHEELRELARAGLTPLRALQCATVNAVQFLGRSDDLGAVAPGRLADFVLLDANPLVDIGKIETIAGVVRAGNWHSREALKTMRTTLSDVPQPSPATYERR